MNEVKKMSTSSVGQCCLGLGDSGGGGGGVHCDKQLPQFNDETCRTAEMLREWIDVICGGDTTILIQEPTSWFIFFCSLYNSIINSFSSSFKMFML